MNERMKAFCKRATYGALAGLLWVAAPATRAQDRITLTDSAETVALVAAANDTAALAPIRAGSDSVFLKDSSAALPIKEAIQDGDFRTKAELREVVEQWNAALTPLTLDRLKQLYYDGEVLYYGERVSPDRCIDDKRAYMAEHPGYVQELAGEIVYDSINQVTYRCSFLKRIKQNDGLYEYPAYLVMMRLPDGWRITAEGDGATDYNRKKTEIGGTRGGGMSEGDFNGTGAKGYVWLEPPVFAKTDDEDAGCLGECDGTIRFLNPMIPPIKVRHCIDGTPDNLGDLNDDGADEVGLLPIWFTGCWSDYHVWTLQDGRWIEAIESFPTHCDQWKTGQKPVEVDPKRPGYVIVRYSESGKNGGITVKSKSVPIRGGKGAAPDPIMLPKR